VTILSGDLNGDDGPGFANNDENSYHVFYHADGAELDATAALNGFTVSGGNANHPTNRPFQIGGGMLNALSSPTLHNCTFSNNAFVDEGGGIYNWTSSPLLYNCTFEGNSASYGGGMNNTLSSPTLAKCLFSGNSAASRGGGMNNNTDSSPEVINCTFRGNSAGTDGGGMADIASSSPTLVNCTFWGNSAGSGGGGLYNGGSSPVLTNCTFWGNSASNGGGIYNLNAGSPTLTNVILWGDTAGGLPNEIYDVDSSPVVTYSNVQGSYPGTGNIDARPLFVDPDHGDLHLHPCSPCIDAGTNAASFLPSSDFELDPRIVDGDGNGSAIVDMGVDELAAPGTCLQLHLPLVFRAY
jgi:hypothetical protein